MEVITLNLSDRPRAEVHQNSYRKLRGPQIAKGLELFALPYLGDAFTLDDDIAARHTYHEIHLDKGFQRFAFEDGMMLILLDDIEALRLQAEEERLLINVFWQPGAQIGMNVVHTAHNGIDVINERLTFRTIDGQSFYGDFHVIFYAKAFA